MESPENDPEFAKLEAALSELCEAPEPDAVEISALIDAVEDELKCEVRKPRRAWWLVAAAAALLAVGPLWNRPQPKTVPVAAVDALLEPMSAFSSFANSATPQPEVPPAPPTLMAYQQADNLDELLWQHGRELLPHTPESYN
jgi:hypothetical protein